MFKVGQRVWDSVNFPNVEGVVIKNNIGNTYPILVNFDDEKVSYTKDGRIYEDEIQTLFPHPYQIEIKPLPIPEDLPEKGQVVYVRQSKATYWVVGLFDKKINDLYYIEGYRYGWEELSTKNPFEK